MAIELEGLELRIDSGGWVDSMESANKSADNLSKSILQQGLAIAGLVVSFNQITDAVKSAVNATLEFNKGLGQIQTLIPGNAERAAELRDVIRDLSLEFNIPFQDLQAGLFDTISAFGDSEQTVDRFRNVVIAAKAAGGSTSESLRLLSSVTKGYGDTSSEALGKVSDLAFTINKLGQTTVPELASALPKVVASSAALGISQENLAAVFATLTGVTGNAAEVSTQLKAVNTSLLKPTDTLAAAFKKMGVESGKAAIEQFGFQGTLQRVFKTLGESDTAFAKALGSSEALTLGLAVNGQQAQKFNENLQAANASLGATSEAAAASVAGFASTAEAFKAIQSIANDLRIELGDRLIPIIIEFIDIFIDLDKPVEERRKQIKEFITDIITLSETVAAVTLAIGAGYVGSLATAGASTAAAIVSTNGLSASMVGLSNSLKLVQVGFAPIVAVAGAIFLDTANQVNKLNAELDVLNENLTEQNRIDDEKIKRFEKRKALAESVGKTELDFIMRAKEIGAKAATDEFKALAKEQEERQKNLQVIRKEIEAKKESIKLAAGAGGESIAVETGTNELSKARILQTDEEIQQLEIKKRALELAASGEISLAEATFTAGLAIKGKTELSENAINKTLEGIRATEKLNSEIKKEEEARKAQADAIKKAADARDNLIKGIDDQLTKSQRNIELLNAGKETLDKNREAMTALTLEGENFNKLQDSEKAKIIAKAAELDKSIAKEKELLEVKKNRAADEGVIESIEKEIQALKAAANGEASFAESLKLSGEATDAQREKVNGLVTERERLKNDDIVSQFEKETTAAQLSGDALNEETARKKLNAAATDAQVKALADLIKQRSIFENDKVIEKLEMERKENQLTGDALKELEAKRLLNADATQEQVDKVEALLALKEADDIAAKIKDLEKELEFQKLSNKERAVEIALRKAGLTTADDASKKKALALIAEIDKQKELNEEKRKEEEAARKAREETTSLKKEQADVIDLSERRKLKEKELQELALKGNVDLSEIITERLEAQKKLEADVFGILKSEIESTLTSIDKFAEVAGTIQDEIDKIQGPSNLQERIDRVTVETKNIRSQIDETENAQEQARLLGELQKKIVERYNLEKELAEDVAAKQRDNISERLAGLKSEADQQKDNAAKLRNLSRSLSETVDDLAISEFSGISQEERVDILGQRFEEALKSARAGDVSAIEKLPDLAESLLGESQEAFAGGEKFAEIFNEVQGGLAEVAEISEKQAVIAESEADRLNEQIAIEEKSLAELAAGNELQEKAINELQSIKNLTEKFGESLQGLDARIRAGINEAVNGSRNNQGNQPKTQAEALKQIASQNALMAEFLEQLKNISASGGTQNINLLSQILNIQKELSMQFGGINANLSNKINQQLANAGF